jgi:hypothetical protein
VLSLTQLRGVALAHAYLILQSEQNRENELAPDLIALYWQCLRRRELARFAGPARGLARPRAALTPRLRVVTVTTCRTPYSPARGNPGGALFAQR